MVGALSGPGALGSVQAVPGTDRLLPGGGDGLLHKGDGEKIARPLESGGLGAEDRTQEVQTHAERLAANKPLMRIAGEDNSSRYKSGVGRQMSCYICRRYRKKRQNTCWMCRRCSMPLCKKNRKRHQTCLEVHQCEDNPYLGYGKMACGKNQWTMPKELQVYNRTRNGGRK